jgi:hypothetical protein
MIRPGLEYRTVATVYAEQLDETTWTVAPVQNGQ